MNRSHNSEEAINCIHLAKKVGFENISIDLIYGLPNQSLKDWKKNLNKVFALNIPHFSSYALTIEEKTVLKYLVEKKKITPLNEEKVNKQFNILMEMAKENGFVHYEISNFAKTKFESVHNQNYWNSINWDIYNWKCNCFI